MQLIPLQNFIIKTCFTQFLWLFRLKCWFKGQMIFRIHLSLPNAYKLTCFDRNVNGNRDDTFFDWDYWSLHWPKKLTLVKYWYSKSWIKIKENQGSQIFAVDFCENLTSLLMHSRFSLILPGWEESAAISIRISR